MTDANKVMHRQHFATDLTGIWIQINPKIWIRILDHFWLKVDVGGGLHSLSALVVLKPSLTVCY